MKRICIVFAPLIAACVPFDRLDRPIVGGRDVETAVIVAPPPAPNARTVEQFDTTTEEQRVAAVASGGGQLLGTVTATLGDPSKPGFWIETGLVTEKGRGKLRYAATGRSVSVELIPVSGGSARVSLSALRLLEAPLADLAVLQVFSE